MRNAQEMRSPFGNYACMYAVAVIKNSFGLNNWDAQGRDLRDEPVGDGQWHTSMRT